MPQNEIAINDLVITIVAGTVSFVVITCAIIAILVAFNRKKLLQMQKIISMERVFQKQLMQSRIEVQEETSSLLAKELHDNVGQLLTGTKILMGLAERQITSQVSMPDTLLQAQLSLEKAIQELRTLSKALDADWISRFDFIENLQQQVQRINENGVICCTLSIPDQALTLSPDKQIMLFRIVQEGIHNAMKHSGTNDISINISHGEDRIAILITDTGSGWNPETEQGMGITNMRQRTELLGGSLAIETVPGNGTQIAINIPLS